jgi:hypothetical protein
MEKSYMNIICYGQAVALDKDGEIAVGKAIRAILKQEAANLPGKKVYCLSYSDSQAENVFLKVAAKQTKLKPEIFAFWDMSLDEDLSSIKKELVKDVDVVLLFWDGKDSSIVPYFVKALEEGKRVIILETQTFVTEEFKQMAMVC